MKSERFMVNVGSSFQVVDVADIVFIETEKAFLQDSYEEDGSFYLQNESLNKL